MESQVFAYVNFYSRQRLWRHIVTLCDGGLKKKPTDPFLLFWRSFGLVQEGQVGDALRGFEQVQKTESARDLEYAVLCALVYTHQQARLVDEEQLALLTSQLVTLTPQQVSNERTLTMAAGFLWHTNQIPKAKEVCAALPGSAALLALRGWMDLQSDRAPVVQKAGQLFDQAFEAAGTPLGTSSGRKDLMALLGKAKYHEQKLQFQESVALLDQVIVHYEWFLPGLTEKARVLLKMNEWDQVLEVAQRALSIDAKNVEALRLVVVFYLIREGSSSTSLAAVRWNTLSEVLTASEPQNHFLFNHFSKLVFRLCSSRAASSILDVCLTMAERAVQLSPKSPEYLCEVGMQLISSKQDVAGARLRFRKARDLDGSNLDSLFGLIRCDLAEGKVDDSVENMQFLKEVAVSLEPARAAHLHYLAACVGHRSGNISSPQAIAELAEALGLLSQAQAAAAVVSEQYLLALNARLLVEICQEILNQMTSSSSSSSASSLEPLSEGERPPEHLQRVISSLELLCTLIPGHLEAQMLYAQCKFLCRDIEGAKSKIGSLTNAILALAASSTKMSNPDLAAVYLLSAQVFLFENKHVAALNACDQALTCDLSLRTGSVLFSVVRARALSAIKGREDEAVRTLELLLEQLPAVATSSTRRAGIFLELATLHSRMGRIPEATKYLSDAQNIYRGTPEEHKITLFTAQHMVNSTANASFRDALSTDRVGAGPVMQQQQLLQKGDLVEEALALLRTVPKSSAYYTQSRLQMARYQLQYKRDRRAYVQCYEDLARDSPKSVQAQLTLGDALMDIQEPEQAVEKYQLARQISQEQGASGSSRDGVAAAELNALIASKIGRALVATFDFKRAIEYYSTAVRNDPQRTWLRHDLALLFLRLKEYDKAEKILREGIGQPKTSLQGMLDDTKSLVLIARVQSATNATEECLQTLQDARTRHSIAMKRLRLEAPDMIPVQSAVAGALCYTIADQILKNSAAGGIDRAVPLLMESLRFDETNKRSALALCRCYLKSNDLDACRQQCEQILQRIDPGNEEASIILSDLMIRQSKQEMATEQLEVLMRRHPTQFHALVELIQLLKRAGRLSDAHRYVRQAEKACSSSSAASPLGAAAAASASTTTTASTTATTNSTGAAAGTMSFPAGLKFARGLLYRLLMQPREALLEFNAVRGDPRWGQRAAEEMFHIYINPDDSELWSVTDFSKMFPNGSSDENLQSAERLLMDIAPSNKRTRTLMEGYLHLVRSGFTGKQGLEQSVQTFMNLLTTDADDVAALVGASIALVVMKQQPKARNHLKRVAKMNFLVDQADDFEQAYLLLADIYIQGGKYDLAQELLKKTIAINNSCGRSWELMGLIHEKEQAYKDASDCYERAWQLDHQRNASVGYKLAFNYLKAKRYVEAIDICHAVLAMNPNYPKIQKEILDKARGGLRP